MLDGKENHGRYTEISVAQANALRTAQIKGDSLTEIQETVASQRDKITEYYI